MGRSSRASLWGKLAWRLDTVDVSSRLGTVNLSEDLMPRSHTLSSSRQSKKCKGLQRRGLQRQGLQRQGLQNRSLLAQELQATTLCLLLVLSLACAPATEDTTSSDGTDDLPLVALQSALSEADPPMLNILAKGAENCPPYEQEDLDEPVKILPVDGVLETQLVVAMRDRCVPVLDKETKQWGLQRLPLRTYGHPRDPQHPITVEEVKNDLDSPKISWTAPGPTLVWHTATAPGANDGTHFKMTLFNALEPQEDPHACDELERLDPRKQGPFTVDTAPNCFHGDNSTNFHMHGSHVSPQPHQDFVGLELLPYGAEAPHTAVHGSRGDVAIGSYDYDVDRIRYTQAPGTHWYHAHKHGSTALQVINGLVGTLEVRGEFDAELESLFEDQGGLPDRLMVVQQLQRTLSGLANDPNGAPSPLVNGQANPIVRMKPGEIQRWRFVGATMNDSATLDISFKGPAGSDPERSPLVRQIAMDGVQFAPENYACQPILNGPDCESGTADDKLRDLSSFRLTPGTRVDLLVKAPTTPGTHAMSYDVAGNLHVDVVDLVEERMALEAEVGAVDAAAPPEDPPLLTVIVEAGESVGSKFPTQAEFPRLPGYLADIEGPFVDRTAAYQMNDKQGNLEQVRFAINGTAYNPDCVNESMVIDRPEAWTLTNNSGIAHPFHIHTNPFQLISEVTWVKDGDDGDYVRTPLDYKAPYVWRDTVPIPTVGGDIETEKGEAQIRYVGREFTGEFVNHCHILGHEDRGMMHNVQVTCENGDFGKPTSDLSAECREGNYLPAAPICDPETGAAGAH